MKRHSALRTLSVDHQHGLAHAQRLMKAARGELDTQATAEAFLSFWAQEVQNHFREEEDILLPIVARYTPALLREAPVGEMLVQHACIRGFVLEMSDDLGEIAPTDDLLHRTGALLDEHIRLEERVIFPAFQDGLPEAALKILELAIAGDRASMAATGSCAIPAAGKVVDAVV